MADNDFNNNSESFNDIHDSGNDNSVDVSDSGNDSSNTDSNNDNSTDLDLDIDDVANDKSTNDSNNDNSVDLNDVGNDKRDQSTTVGDIEDVGNDKSVNDSNNDNSTDLDLDIDDVANDKSVNDSNNDNSVDIALDDVGNDKSLTDSQNDNSANLTDVGNDKSLTDSQNDNSTTLTIGDITLDDVGNDKSTSSSYNTDDNSDDDFADLDLDHSDVDNLFIVDSGTLEFNPGDDVNFENVFNGAFSGGGGDTGFAINQVADIVDNDTMNNVTQNNGNFTAYADGGGGNEASHNDPTGNDAVAAADGSATNTANAFNMELVLGANLQQNAVDVMVVGGNNSVGNDSSQDDS